MNSWISKLLSSVYTRMFPGPPVAAPKVFAIPELLEKILIFYGCDDANIDDNGLLPQPLRGLYRLQRVNRTFRDNITDSKTLRQLMFLEDMHHSNVSVSKLQSQATLLWFLRGLAVGVVDGSFGLSISDYTLHYKGKRTTASEISQQKALEHPPWMGPEASWRRMKLMATTPIILKSQFINFGVKGDWYTKTIECPADSTLGAFFDAYLKLEEGITEGVARFEERRRLCLARREALQQKHVGQYVLYQRKLLWVKRMLITGHGVTWNWTSSLFCRGTRPLTRIRSGTGSCKDKLVEHMAWRGAMTHEREIGRRYFHSPGAGWSSIRIEDIDTGQ